ncbi:MAG: hypothetical protein ABIR79_04025 [Candidatus Binatia bacterium]
MTTTDDETKAAQQFRGYILEKLTDERGVHAETAVAAAARMAGTFLLRSCHLPMESLEPGTPVLSDAVNERGPLLVEILGVALQAMNIEVDMTRANAANHGGAALLTVPQTQSLLEIGMIGLKDRFGLDYEHGARAAALAAAFLIKDTAGALDPSTAFGIAAYGFVEGAKTVPQRLSDLTPPAAKK